MPAYEYASRRGSTGGEFLEGFRAQRLGADPHLPLLLPKSLPRSFSRSTFELMINLKTAKGLGLTIPEALLIHADKVVE
jgi:hypothetical protein